MRGVYVHVIHEQNLNVRTRLYKATYGAIAAALKNECEYGDLDLVTTNSLQSITEKPPYELKYMFTVTPLPQTANGANALNQHLLKGNPSDAKDPTSRHMSAILKHYDALKIIATQPDDTLHLILEDDARVIDPTTFAANFITMCRAMSATPDAGIVYIGKPEKPRNPAIEPPIIRSNTIPRSSAAYMVRPSFAAKIIPTFFPVRFPANVQLASAALAANYDIFIATDDLLIDGSKIGEVGSTILRENAHIYDPEFVAIASVLRPGIPKDECNAILERMKQDVRYSFNPDYIHMRAIALMEANQLDDAKDAFICALHEHQSNSSNSLQNSRFILHAIEAWKRSANA